MVGAELRELSAPPRRRRRRAGAAGGQQPVAAEAAPLRRRARRTSRSTCAAGEIVGIAGVAGNGQDEFFDALSGERLRQRADADPHRRRAVRPARRQRAPAAGRRLRAGGAARPWRGAALQAVGERRAHPPRHRRGHGPRRRRRLRRRRATIGGRVTEAFDVRKGTPDPEASALSGGNLQKFVVGREFDRKPGVLVVSQPTWGVDAGAATTIRQALSISRARGSAVLVISQDLDEIFEISDRIAVISQGRLSAAARRRTASRARRSAC